MKLDAVREVLRHPLFFPLYVPSLAYMFAHSMLIPVLPLYAADFGVTYGLIGLLLAGEGLGMIVADVPAGMLLRRLGSRQVMLFGLMGTAVSTMALFWATSVPEAIGYRLVAGMCAALYNVARHDYISSTVTTTRRGRAIALFGGVFRLSKFLGPATGAAIAAAFGLRATFLAFGVFTTIAFIVVAWALPDHKIKRPELAPQTRLLSMVRANRRLLTIAGVGQIFVMMIRSGTQAIVPLYGSDVIGLEVQDIGLIMSIAAAVDMAMFFPAGMIMDRKGRKYAIVPSFALQALGMAMVPLTGSFLTLTLAASVIGFANGLSSGTMMTIGADLAPPDSRSEFLGVWRLIGDMGASGGPLVVGWVAGALTLGASALVIAGAGVLAAITFGMGVPETLKREKADVA